MAKKLVATTSIGVGMYLVHNTGCELQILGGPYTRYEDLEPAIVRALKRRGFKDDHTLHTLEVKNGKLEFGEFSGGEMDEFREKAGVGAAP